MNKLHMGRLLLVLRGVRNVFCACQLLLEGLYHLIIQLL